MPVPKRRHSKWKVRKKRNEKMKQSVAHTTKCKKCNADKLPHRVCGDCGTR